MPKTENIKKVNLYLETFKNTKFVHIHAYKTSDTYNTTSPCISPHNVIVSLYFVLGIPTISFLPLWFPPGVFTPLARCVVGLSAPFGPPRRSSPCCVPLECPAAALRSRCSVLVCARCVAPVCFCGCVVSVGSVVCVVCVVLCIIYVCCLEVSNLQVGSLTSEVFSSSLGV